MAFDQPTRSRLQKFVSDSRDLLVKEFTRQLQNEFGLDPASGSVTPLENLRDLDDSHRETARILRETLSHYIATTPSGGNSESLQRIVREQSFTVLNRLAALRMAEARDLLIESVALGYKSKGFQLYARMAGVGLGETGDAYRSYLFGVCDEFALDLAVLFDRFSPNGRMFPHETALLGLLGLINDPDIEALWAEDETIGWIYQYFNSKEERKKMRESSAPRNSRELAVRNQFFTPRYVVEFLTDNTLGRIWYEMIQSETQLRDQCRYLVRRPNEIFLKAGENAPEQPREDNLTPEQLLHQPVYITHRPLKDPREIRMLDPACGSMHFGLYAFDLFEVIYDEAWEIAHSTAEGPKSSAVFAPFVSFVVPYADKAAFLADVPQLIIENNLHGIDIDLRATQIAGLSLWLRAQRTWQRQGLRPQARPRVRRSNIVCAEPMPGEEAFLSEFIEVHLSAKPERKLLGQLVRRVFDAMKLAGEVGSLLKIEEEIGDAVAEAKQKWLTGPKIEQGRLFADHGATPEQRRLDLDVTGITDEVFWERAEERIYAALQAYAGQAEHRGYQRRLFADDTSRGFAFIDLCRKRYDVVLMNPPFGEFVADTVDYCQRTYPETFIDFFACFVERGTNMLSHGLLGAITPRAFLFTKTLESWRDIRIIDSLNLLLDMGFGVLDASTVETCAYVISANSNLDSTYIIDLRSSGPHYSSGLEAARSSTWSRGCLRVRPTRFRTVPRKRFLYYLGDGFLDLLQSRNRFDPKAGTAKNGLQTYGDERFLRLIWEVRPSDIGPKAVWVPIAKGGDYETFYFPIHLLMNYANHGLECGEVNKQDNGQTAQTKRNSIFYYKPAATYPSKSTKGFSVRQLPSASLFALKGPAIIVFDEQLLGYVLGWANSDLIRGLVMSQASTGEYLAGILQNLPWINPNDTAIASVGKEALSIANAKRSIYAFADEDIFFRAPWPDGRPEESIALLSRSFSNRIMETNAANRGHLQRLNDAVVATYGVEAFDARDWGIEEEDHNIQIFPDESGQSQTSYRLLSYTLGIAFGRWDIRFATVEQLVSEPSDPFASLPICPPGQLQNEKGLPVTKEEVEKLKDEGRWNCPVEIPWQGILVDDSGHPFDIESRVHQVLQIIWSDRWQGIEHEACEILSVPSVREYFRRPTGFFADHLKRYSKSRRQAPIYWPLSTASGSYTLWLYYHRLTDQTLYTCVNEYIDPKLRDVRDALGRLRAKATGRSPREDGELERLHELEPELQELRDELLRLAELPWRPNLNDGVQITAAPLWRLFRLPKWQKTLKETLEKLERGDFDWAHLCYTVWPDRVREKCKTDKSLSIAHGLEDLYVEPPPSAKKKRKGKPAMEVVSEMEEE